MAEKAGEVGLDDAGLATAEGGREADMTSEQTCRLRPRLLTDNSDSQARGVRVRQCRGDNEREASKRNYGSKRMCGESH